MLAEGMSAGTIGTGSQRKELQALGFNESTVVVRYKHHKHKNTPLETNFTMLTGQAKNLNLVLHRCAKTRIMGFSTLQVNTVLTTVPKGHGM